MQKHFPLILVILFAALAPASAQQSAPPWVQKIRLSGLSGPPDHRLAAINNKTFASGEENNLKLAGKVVSVKCLEIRDSSVLVQIQDLPSPYILTIDGRVYAQQTQAVAASTIEPVTVSSPPPPATYKPPAPTVVQPVNPFIPAKLAIPLQPVNTSNIFSVLLFLAGIFLALFIGIAIGTAAVSGRYLLYRKNIGEAMLAETIDQQFKRPHFLLNNITLPTTEGTTQIDHVLVADTGIFVIDAKHYNGWIFGNPRDEQWTQTIYRAKARFQNPLRQNYGHIKAVQALFNLSEDHFHNVVVFTGNAEFKSELGPNVLHLAGLLPFLAVERPVLFDERKMAYVIGWIEMKRLQRSRETDEYHINYVRRQISRKIFT